MAYQENSSKNYWQTHRLKTQQNGGKLEARKIKHLRRTSIQLMRLSKCPDVPFKNFTFVYIKSKNVTCKNVIFC